MTENLTVLHPNLPVRGLRHFLAMSDNQEGKPSLFSQLPQQFEDFLLARTIEVPRWLIRQQQARVIGESTRNRNPLPLNPNLTNLLMDDFFSSALNKYQASWRKALIHAIELGVPTPAFSTALAFYDGYRTERLPANLLQAQRDFFGAHTYERVDKPRGEFFHTNWTGRGGRVSSSTYNA